MAASDAALPFRDNSGRDTACCLPILLSPMTTFNPTGTATGYFFTVAGVSEDSSMYILHFPAPCNRNAGCLPLKGLISQLLGECWRAISIVSRLRSLAFQLVTDRNTWYVGTYPQWGRHQSLAELDTGWHRLLPISDTCWSSTLVDWSTPTQSSVIFNVADVTLLLSDDCHRLANTFRLFLPISLLILASI